MLIFLSYVILSFLLTVPIYALIFSCRNSAETYGDFPPYTRICADEKVDYYVFSAESEYKKTVVLSGGMKSAPALFCRLIRALLRDGHDVLYICRKRKSIADCLKGFRLFGEDIQNAVVYLTKKGVPERDIVVIGHSAGGYGAVCRFESRSAICAVVSICAFCSELEIMRYYAKKAVGFWADLQLPFLYLFLCLSDRKALFSDVFRTIDLQTVPIYFIEAAPDRTVPEKLGFMRYREKIRRDNVYFRQISSTLPNAHSDVLQTEAETIAHCVRFVENRGMSR